MSKGNYNQHSNSLPSAPGEHELPPSYEQSMHHEIVQPIQAHFSNTIVSNTGYPTKQHHQASYQPNTSQQKSKKSPYPIQTAYPVQISVQPIATQVPYHQGMMPAPNFRPNQQVNVPDCFDAGARFSGKSPPSIPPPPPGVAPNMAQLAAQSGSQVVTSKKKSNFFMGSKGAGWTFW